MLHSSYWRETGLKKKKRKKEKKEWEVGLRIGELAGVKFPTLTHGISQLLLTPGNLLPSSGLLRDMPAHINLLIFEARQGFTM